MTMTQKINDKPPVASWTKGQTHTKERGTKERGTKEPGMSHMNFLKQTPLFANMSDLQLQKVAEDMIPRHFKQGEVIFREGDPGQVLYLVKSGQVRIYVSGLDGSETSVILMGRPGDIFGELAIIDGLPRSATAMAMVDTTLCTLSRENFRQHMRQYPQLALNFMMELSERVRYNTKHVTSLATQGVPQRLARKLMELAQVNGRVVAEGVCIAMPLTQTDLASLIGATRESINKSLRDFRHKNWILVREGQYIILDPDALRAQVTA